MNSNCNIYPEESGRCLEALQNKNECIDEALEKMSLERLIGLNQMYEEEDADICN